MAKATWRTPKLKGEPFSTHSGKATCIEPCQDDDGISMRTALAKLEQKNEPLEPAAIYVLAREWTIPLLPLSVKFTSTNQVLHSLLPYCGITHFV